MHSVYVLFLQNFTFSFLVAFAFVLYVSLKGLIWDQLFRLKKTVTLESIQDIA